MLNLRAIREQLRLTQDEISDLMGIAKATYSQTERGDREPTREFICRFAEAVGEDIGKDTEMLLNDAGLRLKPPFKPTQSEWWVPRIRLALRGLGEDQINTVINVSEAAALGLRQRNNKDSKGVRLSK